MGNKRKITAMRKQIIFFLFMTITLSSFGQNLSAYATATPEKCGQQNGTATVIASGGTGTYTYHWNTMPAQTTSFISGLAAGTYTVTVSDGLNTTTASAIVYFVPGPTAAFTMTFNQNILTITDHSYGNNISWNWNLCAFGSDTICPLPNINFDSIIFPPGNYTVHCCEIVCDVNGCTDTSCASMAISVIDSSIYDPVSISPNPSLDKFTIITYPNSTIEILNLKGQMIKSIKGINKSNIVDLTDLESGFYFVKVNSDKGEFIKKILKE